MARSSKRLRIVLLAVLMCSLCAFAAAEETATPSDLAPVSGEIIPEVIGAEQDRDGIWHLAREEDGVLHFRWSGAGAECYDLTLEGPENLIVKRTVATPLWNVPEKELPAGSYTLEIFARNGTETVGFGLLQLELEEASAPEGKPQPESPEVPDEPEGSDEPENPENPEGPEEPEEPKEPEEPGKMPAKPSGGKRPAGKGNTKNTIVKITPGKALISTHAKGTGILRAYGAVDPEAGEGVMTVLTLGDEELELSCGENTFTAEVEEDELVLTTEGGDEWQLTMDVLKTLNISGISRVRMLSPDAEAVLDTDMELTGVNYGRERAKGFVSADFVLFRSEGEWRLRVEDREYAVETAEREEI